MSKRNLIQIIGPRLLIALVAGVGSLFLGAIYHTSNLGGTTQVVVVLLFYVLVSAWPCLLVSAAFRTLQYMQQWR